MCVSGGAALVRCLHVGFMALRPCLQKAWPREAARVAQESTMLVGRRGGPWLFLSLVSPLDGARHRVTCMGRGLQRPGLPSSALSWLSRGSYHPLQPQAIPSMKQDKFLPEAARVSGQSSASKVVLGSNPGCPALALVFCGNTGHGLLGLPARGRLRIWECRLGGRTDRESTPSFSPLWALREDTAAP